jgi:integrase
MGEKFSRAFVQRVVFDVPPTRDRTYSDVELKRHILRVRLPQRPGEAWWASYGIRYTLKNGRKTTMMTCNARTVEPDAARAIATLELAKVDKGEDPVAARRGLRMSWTVRDLWVAYEQSAEFKRMAPLTRKAVGSAFKNHLLHRVGGERIADLELPAVNRVLREVTADKRLNSRLRRMGGAGASRKVAKCLSSALSWAVSQGELQRNELIGGLRLPGDVMREVVITTPEEYVSFLTALDTLVAAGKLRLQSSVFLTCAAFTGLRRGELQTLTAGQVDLANRRLKLLASKGARLAKKGVRAEMVSLPPIAAAALAQIISPDAAAGDLVFVPRQGKLLEINRDWQRVRAQAKLPAKLTLHGLRHSFATSAVLAGLSGPEVQALLRHRDATMSSRYIHLAQLTQLRLQDRVATHLGADPRPTAEVRRLRRRAG